MATTTIDLSAGLMPKQDASGQVDLSAGLVSRSDAAQPGFWENLGHTVGIGKEEQAQREQYAKDHPILNTLKQAGGPAVQMGEMLYGQGKQTLGELGQGITSLREGNPAQAATHAISAVPLVGPALTKMAAEAPPTTPGQSYGSRVLAAATPGNIGTALGTAAQVAPMLLGAVDNVAPNRPTIPNPPVGKAIAATGQAAQDAGTGLMNKTVGTLKADFKRGANPGRGYLETGNGPSISMRSIAEKADAALEDTGNKLGAAYKQATDSGVKIPVDTVMQEMAKPIQKAIDLELGPGGTGNLAAIQSYISRFDPVFEKAAQNGGFTPSELFDMKRSIAQNTNWSDPAQFSLKSVRQQQTGALGGVLSDYVTGTKELNQNYQDLTKLTARAEERANTGSRPLTAHIYKAMLPAAGALIGSVDGNALAGAAVGTLLDSVPAKTTIATGLYRGGRALSRVGERLTPSNSAPVKGVTANNVVAGDANNEAQYRQLTPAEQLRLKRSRTLPSRMLP